jgi:hypothetical protein
VGRATTRSFSESFAARRLTPADVRANSHRLASTNHRVSHLSLPSLAKRRALLPRSHAAALRAQRSLASSTTSLLCSSSFPVQKTCSGPL